MSLRHNITFRTGELPIDNLGLEIDSRTRSSRERVCSRRLSCVVHMHSRVYVRRALESPSVALPFDDQYHTMFSFSGQMAPVASIIRHKVALCILSRRRSQCTWQCPMFIYHGGIEKVKLWCEVRCICVVFAVKCLFSCVCLNI